MSKSKKILLANFMIVSVLSFVLLFCGIRFILDNHITAQNLLVFVLVSVILGFISSILYLLKFKIAYVIFNLGLLIGYFEMYRLFYKDMDGWGDLTGLITLFAWIILGFGLGSFAELVLFIYKRYHWHKYS